VKKKDINIGHQLQGTGSDKIYKVKGDRQQTIMTFIDDRKAASIKDISALFTDVSEKTIQRELSSLVASGKISKRGSKRWSVYMAAGTPV
jgi:predicted HTH transcriptional regulator